MTKQDDLMNALTPEELEEWERDIAKMSEKLKGVTPDMMYFTETDFAGVPAHVRGDELEAWHKEQKELKEKFDRGEIPDPYALTQEEQELAELLFTRRKPE